MLKSWAVLFGHLLAQIAFDSSLCFKIAARKSLNLAFGLQCLEAVVGNTLEEVLNVCGKKYYALSYCSIKSIVKVNDPELGLSAEILANELGLGLFAEVRAKSSVTNQNSEYPLTLCLEKHQVHSRVVV